MQRQPAYCCNDSSFGGGANFFDVVGGEIVFGGAVEDCFEVVGGGAEALFDFCGDINVGGDGAAFGINDIQLGAAVVDGGAFEAIEIAVRGFADFVEYAEDDAAGGGADIGSGGAAADTFVEDELVIIEAAGAVFGDVAGAGAHLSATHIAAVCEVPDGCGHVLSDCA
jgi:hypothetical protein